MLNLKLLLCTCVLLHFVLPSSEQQIHYCSHLPEFFRTMMHGLRMPRSIFLAEPTMLAMSNYSLFEFTCTTSRILESSTGYHLRWFPDQCNFVYENAEKNASMPQQIDFVEHVYIDVAQLKHELSRRTGLSPNETIGFFEEANLFKRYRDAIEKENSIVIEHIAKIHTNRLKIETDTLVLGPTLRGDYKKFMRTHNKSHPLFEDGTSFYFETLNKFGSHFAIDTELGSYMWQTAVIDSFFLEQFGRKWISRMLKKHLTKFIGGKEIEVKIEGQEDDDADGTDELYDMFIDSIQIKLCQYNSEKKFSGCTDDANKWTFNNESVLVWDRENVYEDRGEKRRKHWKYIPYSYSFLDAKLVSIERLLPLVVQNNFRVASDIMFAKSDIINNYHSIKSLIQQYQGLVGLIDQNLVDLTYEQALDPAHPKSTNESIKQFKSFHSFVSKLHARLILERCHDRLRKLWKIKLDGLKSDEADERFNQLQEQIYLLKISPALDPIEVDNLAVKISDFYYEHMTGSLKSSPKWAKMQNALMNKNKLQTA